MPNPGGARVADSAREVGTKRLTSISGSEVKTLYSPTRKQDQLPPTPPHWPARAILTGCWRAHRLGCRAVAGSDAVGAAILACLIWAITTKRLSSGTPLHQHLRSRSSRPRLGQSFFPAPGL